MAKLKNNVSPTYGSIFRAIEERADECKFGPGFVATQITLTGSCDFQPLYVKVEDCIPETAPYEYHDADFFIDSDTDVPNVIAGKVQLRMFMGSTIKYVVKSGDLEFTVALPQAKARTDISMGSDVRLGVRPEDLLALEEN